MRKIAGICLIVICVLAHGGEWANAASNIDGTLSYDGVTGRSVTAKGWNDEMVYVIPQSGGDGDTDYTDTFPNLGYFNLSLTGGGSFPAGLYSMFTMNLNGKPSFDYMTNVNVPGGGSGFNQNFRAKADYSVQWNDSYLEWGNEPWLWYRDFYQTFTATSRHVTRVGTRMIAKNAGVLNLSFQLLKTNGGAPSTWTPVSPVRTRYIKDFEPNVFTFIFWVPFLSSEVNLTPGQEYALHVWCPDGTTSQQDFGIFTRTDSNDGYANGQLYTGDTPRPSNDMYAYVSGDCGNNSLVNYAPVNNFQTANFINWNGQFGQTFRATGNGLAAIEVPIATGGGDVKVSFRLYNGVGGASIGPVKSCWSGQVHAYLWRVGAFWLPGEAPLTPGQTYYIEGESAGLNIWNMEEGYANGQAYIARASYNNSDVLLSLA